MNENLAMNNYGSPVEQHYSQLLVDLYDDLHCGYGVLNDRTGTGRVTHTGAQLSHNMEDGFPILEAKKVWFKGALVETLWMLNGRTDLEYLHEHNVHYWDSWALEDGTLGPTYGEQIRRYKAFDYSVNDCDVVLGLDQWRECVDSIQNDPNSRRHIITTWQPHALKSMGLPPCHGLVIQFIPKGELLDLVMYQRSCDIFLGLPFNLCNYGIMLHIMAMLTDMVPGKMTFQFGDLHLYANHEEAALQYFVQYDKRMNEGWGAIAPTLEVKKKDRVEDLTIDDFILHDYHPSPHIPAPVAV